MTTPALSRAAAALLFTAALACGGGDGSNDGGGNVEPNTVRVISNRFEPSTLTVAPGTTVTFHFENGGHNVVSGPGCTPDGQFCSPDDTGCNSPALSSSGTTYTHTFSAAGTYPYFCAPHCAMGMKGTIVVQ